MATKKFSEFDVVPAPVLTDIVVVGLDDAGQNAQFPGDAFEGALGNPGTNGYLLSSTTAGVRSWVAPVAATAWGDITGTLADQTDLNSALGGKEASLGNPGTNGYVLSSTTGGVRSWVAQSGGGGTWGSITGTLSAQTDLQSALDAKLTAASVSPNLPTFSVPASTTISTFGASLVNDADAATGRTTLGAANNRFAYKASATTPIYILSTGQSNPDGVEIASTPFTPNSRVKMYQDTSGACDPDPSVGYIWKTPTPADSIISIRLPNIGYYQGNTGSQVAVLASELADFYGRDVYILQIALSGAQIEYWTSTVVNAGTFNKTMTEALIEFNTYVLGLPELAGVTYPDIFLWGQSESNAGGKAGFTCTPDAYRTLWQTMYDDLVAGGAIDPEITKTYLTEPTQYVNQTGTGGAGGGTVDYPWKWEGLNAVCRYNGTDVTLVSSIGVPWLTSPGVGAAWIHYTGDGNNLYGKKIADVVIGRDYGTRSLNTEVVRDLTPVLGGNLNAASKDISSVATLTATTATLTNSTITNLTLAGNLAAGNYALGGVGSVTVTGSATDFSTTPPAAVLVTADHTYSGGNTILPGFALGGTHTYSTNLAAISSAFNNAPVIINSSGLATTVPNYFGVNSQPTFTAVDAALTQLLHTDYTSNPTYNRTGTGTISLTLPLTHFYTNATVGVGCTIGTRLGFRAGAATISGTISSEAAFCSEIGTGAGNSTHVLLGTSIVPAGDFAIYQSDALVNRWGGGHRFPYRASSATTISMTTADFFLNVTTTSAPAQVDLPTAVGNTGLYFIIKRTGTQTVTINPLGAQTLDGTATQDLLTANHLMVIISDGANWLIIEDGAP